MSAKRITAGAAAVIVALLAGGVWGVVSASANNPGTECDGGAPVYENGVGKITMTCLFPMPDPVTITTPVPTTVTETKTETQTVTASASPTSSPTATSSPTPTPTATSPSPTPPGPTVPAVHGKDITATNTGLLPGACATTQVFTTRQRASVLGSRSCVDLRGGLDVDAAITLTSSSIRGEVNARGPRLTLRWVTVDAAGGEWAIQGHVDCFRCNLSGGSDGIRFWGTNVVESYVRVRSLSSADHNDGVQAYQSGEGGSILRSNISSRPVNGAAYGTAAVFIADNSRGEYVIRDNWLAGGSYTLRLHESGTYRVTGNIVSDWNFGPCSTTNAIPGAFLEWADNRTAAGAVVNR